MKEFDELLEMMHRLRHECPWDKEQSIDSLRPYIIEEAYECLEAMSKLKEHGSNELIDELGDVLLQVIFQSEILSENQGRRIILDVIENLKEKLIRRHPHVFGEAKAENAARVIENWDIIKEKEKGDSPLKSIFDVPHSMTALQRSQKIGKRSKKVKFDWESSEEVWKQVEEEFQELKTANSSSEKEEELGDLLFSLAQWARHEGFDAEVALASCNQKFLSRFSRMQKLHPHNFEELDTAKKEELWRRVKKDETQELS